ncbi:transcriptional regulator [Lamprobacter modestohalophilus]|uniref:HVO_A0114 family putative DNA-binding protein n=1 Tax=Lamprobacter modestohalophilus TaxID=1064514 RepID=UPI002ADEE57C|nr:transcriptional regulator [Lamprobacter modestohalophilus]MEA1052673.1 transcriptional regulator [Lamprobacter modestohalophilus]
MTTLTIDVSSLDAAKERMRAAFAGKPQGCRFTFLNEEALLAMLTPNRWRILKALTGAGPLGVRELARRVERDVKGVHTDAHVLAKCGLIDRTEDGKLLLPYDAVQVRMEYRAAA